MRTRNVLTLLVWILSALPLSAQFHTMGADPGGLRWRSIETPTYRVIYPLGLDSLARSYAVTLEQAATPVGSSIGLRPNVAYPRKMPVVLHAYTAYSNGMVTWTPRRMEMLTVPDAAPSDLTPWVRQLAIHESRHVSQMQPGAMKPFRWLNVLGGQLIPGAIAGLYGGPAFFEGDAVVAETALTRSGRGRTADFLEYYRVSFAAGDQRDFWRWRYGSQRLYTPDYYRAGYLAVGGIRATFGVPDLSKRFYDRVAGHGIAFLNWDKTVREATGLRFKDAFAAVCDTLQRFWAADEAARGPFLETTPLTPLPRRFIEYTDLESVGDRLFATRGGLTIPDQLVQVLPDGTAKPVTLLGAYTSGPMYSEPMGRLYWSEVVRDARWPLRSYSIIRSYDGTSVRKLTRKTRYYNPVPAPEEQVLSVTEYPADGSCRVVLLDAADGSRLREWRVPDGYQVMETAWVGGELYASAISEEGAGLYRVDGFTPVLGPSPVTVNGLWTMDGRLMFVSDLTGVNELYSFDPASGRAERLTNLRFGASTFEPLGDSLYFPVLQREGRMIHKLAFSDLQPQEADFSVLPRHPFAEELAAGETESIDWNAPVELSEPKPYHKLGHLFHIHSWLPFFFQFDSVDDLSFESVTQSAGLGATAFWQNDLGTAYGFAGYHAAPEEGIWRHSLHANFTYEGLYPVIEASVDFGERDALNYYLEKDEEQQTLSLKAKPRTAPSVSGGIKAYIPWNFSSGGWQRGLVPTLNLLWNNDRFTDGQSINRTTLSLRGYIMESTPDSRVYPRFGIGAEAGYSFRWTPGLFAPSLYGYLYGYLPGLFETHGLRWSVLGATHFDGIFCEPFASSAPRGFPSVVSRMLSAYPTQFKGALDYKLPLIPVDRALLGPVAYLRNFELTLHGDFTAFSAPRKSGALFSAGVDLTAVLGNFLWVPYPTRIGVSYNYNGGASYDELVAQELPVQRHTFSLIFSVEM